MFAGRSCELYEAHKSAIAKETLERIASLYAIEEEIRGRSAEDRRAASGMPAAGRCWNR